MDVTKPYEFMRFGAMDVTQPYKFTGFGAMDVTKPAKYTIYNRHLLGKGTQIMSKWWLRNFLADFRAELWLPSCVLMVPFVFSGRPAARKDTGNH
jgi:hypothetical protein